MEELAVEEPSGENLDLVGSIWGASGIWEASGKHLGGNMEASGRHLGSICGRHLGGILEASTLGFPPWSERCLLETPGAKIQADHQCMFLPVCFLLVMCWSILGNCMGNNNGNAT